MKVESKKFLGRRGEVSLNGEKKNMAMVVTFSSLVHNFNRKPILM